MFKLLWILPVAFSGAVWASDYRGIGQDSDLTIDIRELRGVKESTKNMIFIKVTATRKGKSFDVFCSRWGDVEAQAFVNYLSCGKNVNTVSGDDDEALSFEIAQIDTQMGGKTVIRDISYTGDDTFLGDEVRIISGKNP